MSGAGPTSRGVAAVVEPVVERIDRRAPGARGFTLRFWDGSEVPPPPGSNAGLTLIVRSARALEYALRQPNELGFGRAWVTGDLDLEGDLESGLALRECFSGFRMSVADRHRRAARRCAPRRHPRAPARGAGE